MNDLHLVAATISFSSLLVRLCRTNHAKHGESVYTCGEQVGETCFGDGRIALT